MQAFLCGNQMEDKFAKSGLHETKSEFVNAPVIAEFPISLDCELVDVIDTEHVYAMIGKIVNAGAEESVIGDDGKVEPGKIQALIFDQFRNGYYYDAVIHHRPQLLIRTGVLPDQAKKDRPKAAVASRN